MGQIVPVRAFSLGGKTQRGQETQRLVHDGTMYVTRSQSRLCAIVVKTAKELWQFEARVPEARPTIKGHKGA
ncbi:MAG: hypothetical protein ACKO2N_16620 [Tabrizicola sp.]